MSFGLGGFDGVSTAGHWFHRSLDFPGHLSKLSIALTPIGRIDPQPIIGPESFRKFGPGERLQPAQAMRS